MKKILLAVSLFVVSSSCYADAGLPKRKAGLWEISMNMAGMPAGNQSKQCIDDKTDQELLKSSVTTASKFGAQCSEPKVAGKGDSYTIDTECMFNGSKMTSTTLMKGDFNSSYNVVTNVEYNPPYMGMAKSEMKFDAKWLGECAPDQQPGDIIMANGMKMNMKGMQDMAQSLKSAAANNMNVKK